MRGKPQNAHSHGLSSLSSKYFRF